MPSQHYCDIQVNGGLGIGFTNRNLTTEQIRKVADHCLARGVSFFCPTVITSDFETIQASFKALAKAVEVDPILSQSCPFFHLEGPYLSESDGPRGAHPKLHIRNPDWSEFQRWQEAANGRIKIVTLAPEKPAAIDFIAQLTANNIIVAIGHTQATTEQLKAAVDAGARLSTHLGNGCHANLPRHPNIIWDQLADDRLYASIIADGHHLPASVIKTILRTKGIDRVILISDAGTLAGMPAGRYRDWGQDLEVLESGKIVVPGTPFLAGSGVFMDQCVEFLLQNQLATPDEIHTMACVNPRRLISAPIS